MRPLGCCLFLATAVYGASLRERAGIPPVRAPPKVGEVPNSPYHPNNVHPADTPGAGTGAIGGGAAAGRGTAPESTAPFKAENGFYTRNKELIDKALESVEDVFDLLSDVVDLVGGGGDDASSTARLPKPTQVSSTSDGAKNSTANYLLTQGNITYTFFSDPRLISHDVVSEMSGPTPNRLSFQQDLFTSEEYNMFVESPVCFYANIERMYSSAAAEAASASTENSTSSPTASSSSTTESPSPSSEEESTSCADLGVGPTVCTAVAGSPQWTSSMASEISSLWAYQLPDQLWSAHFATPTEVPGEVTATVTSTTSCPAFDGGDGGPVTSYRELKVKGADVGKTSSDGAAMETSNEAMSGVGRVGEGVRSMWWAGVGAVVLGAVML